MHHAYGEFHGVMLPAPQHDIAGKVNIVVNAEDTPESLLKYRTGLCGNTTYEFAAWI